MEPANRSLTKGEVQRLIDETWQMIRDLEHMTAEIEAIARLAAEEPSSDRTNDV